MSLIMILGVLALITYIITEVMLLSKGDNFVKRTFNIDSLEEFIAMNVVFIVLIALAYLILGLIAAYLITQAILLITLIIILMLLGIALVIFTLYYVKKQLYKIYVANKYVGVAKKKSKR